MTSELEIARLADDGNPHAVREDAADLRTVVLPTHCPGCGRPMLPTVSGGVGCGSLTALRCVRDTGPGIDPLLVVTPEHIGMLTRVVSPTVIAALRARGRWDSSRPSITRSGRTRVYEAYGLTERVTGLSLYVEPDGEYTAQCHCPVSCY